MVTRRHAQDAGYSWRKWSDPLMYGPLEPRRSVAGRIVGIWLICASLGALAAVGLVAISEGALR